MIADARKTPVASSTMLELVEVTKRFRQTGQPAVTALDGCSLRVESGEFVAVVGHNGSGKTTLLDVISGDLAPDSGVVRWGTGGNTTLRPTIARVRQSPRDGAFAGLSVRENFQIFGLIGAPSLLRIKPRAHVEESSRRMRGRALAYRLAQRVGNLSQGERQLLALELAMSRSPDVLLLDEHTASLDRRNAQICMEETARLVRDTRTTVVMVTHNLGHALEYSDTLVVLKEGRVTHRLSGSAKATLSLPDLVYFCGFMDSPGRDRLKHGGGA